MSEADDELYDFALSVCSWAADVDKVVSALRAAERRGRIAGLREAADMAYSVPSYCVGALEVDDDGIHLPGSPRDGGAYDARKRITARANALEASE
jgi:hypothetical protein